MRLARACVRAAAGWLAASTLLTAGCNGADAEQYSPRRRALESLGQHVVLPLLDDFAADAQALDEAARALCDERDTRALDAAQAAWSAAHGRFKQAEVLSFGPHTLSPWRLGAKLDFWPAREEEITAQLAGDAAFEQADGGGLQLGAAARGLPAIEYLLHADGDDAVLTALLATDGTASGERRCEYLRALTALLREDALALAAAWRDEFLDELTLASGAGDRYASIQDSFGALINSLAFTAEGVRDQKLGRPFGFKTGGTPQPDQVESRYAGRSIDDALDTLVGIENLFWGRYEDGDAVGLNELLGAQRSRLEAGFEQRLSAARSALRAIPGPLSSAVEHDRPAVQHAIDALEELVVLLQVELTQSLAVTVTFGGNDGD